MATNGQGTGVQPSNEWCYERLIEFWKRQDEDYWNAIRTFLFCESILLGAIGVVLSVDRLDFAIPVIVILAIGGALIAGIWLRVTTRLKDALRLTLHQARNLELDIYRSRLPLDTPQNDDLRGFSMFFWASYATMQRDLSRNNGCRDQDMLAEQFHEMLVRNKQHHDDQVKAKEAWTGSAYDCTSLWLPVIFALICALIPAALLVQKYNLPIPMVATVAGVGLFIWFMVFADP